MNRRILSLAVVGIAACSMASANVTWTFGSGATSGGSQLTNGQTYTVSGSSLTAYAYQETSNLIISAGHTGAGNSCGTYSTVTGCVYQDSGSISSTSDSTLNGLFQVSNNQYGTGIAPYNPNECGGLTTGCTDMNGESGLTDTVGSNANGPTGASQNLVLVHLTATANESLTLVLDSVTQTPADSFNVWTYYQTAAPTALGATTGTSWSNELVVGQPVTTNSNPSTGSYTFNTGASSGSLWVAIQADCHYLLVSSMTAVPGATTPEPRFYGMLLTGLLGVAIAIFRRRSAVMA